MKPLYNFVLLIGAAGTLFTSCSNEDIIQDKPNDSGKTIHMVISAMRESESDAASRTSLTEENGGLSCVWTNGDKILVTDNNGKKLGTLTLKSDYAGKKEGEFEGVLRGVDDGKQNLNYYYLGTSVSTGDNAYNTDIVTSGEPYVADFSTQSGTFESLSDYDILSVAKETIISGDYSYFDKISFQRRVSFARFKMNLPEDAEYPVAVTLTGSELCNKATLSLSDQNTIEYAKGGISIENLSSKEFYITYLPTRDKDVLNFTATDAKGVVFVGSYNVTKAVGQNKYFRKDLGNGNYEGLPINFERTQYDYTIAFTTREGNSLGKKSVESQNCPHTVTIDDYDDDVNVSVPAGYEFKGWALKDTPDVVIQTVEFQEHNQIITVVPVFEAYTIGTPGYDHGTFN